MLKTTTPFLLTILVVLNLQAQDAALLMNFYHLKSGEVYIGSTGLETDSTIAIIEHHLGEVVVRKKQVQKTEPVYRGQLVRIWLADNASYRCRIMEMDATSYTVEMVIAGTVKFQRSEIVKMELLFEQRLDARNPNSTRYFFGPSAIPMEKGSGYYQNVYLLMNSVNFGLTNNFSLGGGVVIPLLFYVTPKVGFEVAKNFYLGAGFIAGTTVIPDFFVFGGIPFGIATVGTTETNFTLGVGYGMVWNDYEYFHTKYPIFTGSGMLRITNKFQLISENWVIPYQRTIEDYDPVTGYFTIRYEDDVFVASSLGLRMIFGQHASIDFAPVYLHTEQDLVVPYLDFVYRF